MEKLEFYKNWSRVVICYMMEIHERNNDREMYKFFNDMLASLDQAYLSQDAIVLRRFFKSMSDIAMHTESTSRLLLNARLRAACGEDLTKYDKRLASSVKRIVKRGKIRNGDEYEKVRTYIDSTEGEPGQEALLKDLYRLADEFEEAVGENPSLVGDEWR